MPSYTGKSNRRYASTQMDTPAAKQRGAEYIGFLAIEKADNLRKVKVVASETATKWTHENIPELLSRVEEIAEEFVSGDEGVQAHIGQVSYQYDGPNPAIKCLIGYGGKPYILVGDPSFVPRRKGRAKEYQRVE